MGNAYKGDTIVQFANTAGSHATGLDIYCDNVRVRKDSSTPLTNTLLGTLKGALSTSDSVSSGNITVTASNPFNVYSAPYQLGGNMTANAGMTFNGAVTLSAASVLDTSSADVTFIGLNVFY